MNYFCKNLLIYLIVFSLAAPFPGFCQQKPTAKISLDVKNMDIIDVLKILADQGGFNISVSGNVRGRVTLFLKDINVWDALEIALMSANLAYEKRGDIIYVMTDKEYEVRYGTRYGDQREAKVFNLKYAKALNVRELLTQVVSSIGKVIMDVPTNTIVVIDTPEKITEMSRIVAEVDKPINTRVFELNYMLAKDLEPKLSETITQGVGILQIDETTNKIIITDYPDAIKEVEEIIEAFDEKPLQVLIDAKIVEIRPSKKYYSGVNWEYWIKQYFRVKGDFTIPSPTATTDKVRFGTIGVADPSEKGDYSGILDFLQTFGDTRVLSSPRILALNNQEAKILVGTKDVYITSSVSEVGDSAVTTQTVNYVDVGVKLYVTPNINREGYITLEIKPEISSSERVEITSDDKVTEIPVVTTSEAETSVIVKEGVTIIIGGLKKITHDKEDKQVPFFGSIPLLGNLFKSKKDDWSKNELVILLTPHIVSGDSSIEAEIQDKIGTNMGEEEAVDAFDSADY